MKSQYTVHKSDKYKNCAMSTDPKYKDVKPLEEHTMNKEKSFIAIFDLPYSTQGGGHTGTNCSLKNSKGKIQFNEQYGTTMKYSVSMILAMILEAVDSANNLLMPGRFLCVKCKDYKGIPYTNEVIHFAREKGIHFSTRDSVVKNPDDVSAMLVFRKVSVKEMNKIEAKCATMTQDELKDQAVVDYQTETLKARQLLAKEKREHTETIVHFASFFKKSDEFKEYVKDSFNFDVKELKDFLHKHNMKTENRGKARDAKNETNICNDECYTVFRFSKHLPGVASQRDR